MNRLRQAFAAMMTDAVAGDSQAEGLVRRLIIARGRTLVVDARELLSAIPFERL